MALFHVDFFSNTIGMMMNMDVIIPQGVPAGEYYKTLYLLHGMSDDHTAWQRRTSIERYADEKRIAVVMPTTHLGWYTDCKFGMKYYTYIAKELPLICRDFFPKMSEKREDTFAAGLSMGGYGSLKLGLLDSETFSAVAPLSGALDIKSFTAEREDFFFGNIFGSVNELNGSDNDLAAAAERLAASNKPKPKIFIWCGSEDFLLDQNHFMRDKLISLGFDVTYTESAGGHEWRCWDEQIKNVLNWLPL